MCLPRDSDAALESADKKRSAEPRVRVTNTKSQDMPRVTFAESSDFHVVEIPTALSCLGTDPDRRQLWYVRDDIQGFRLQAQKLSKQLLDGSSSSTEEESTRGLELRMSLHRQDQRQKIVRRILEAQEGGLTPDEIAQISQLHSVWSRKLALAEAHRDYYAAYHPSLTSVLAEMPTLLSLDCHNDVVTKRRSLFGSSLTETGRRVRCRMF